MSTGMKLLWRTNAFGTFHVELERYGAAGMAALVKFTDSKGAPVEAGADATMWVSTSMLHTPTSPKKTTSRARKTRVKVSAV